MKINLYHIINNNKISSDKYPIFNDIDKLIQSIINDYKKNNIQEINKFMYIDLIIKNEDRSRLMIDIFTNIQDKDLIIKNYIIIPDGRIIGIKNFETTINNLNEIKNMGYNIIYNNISLDTISNEINKIENKIKSSNNIIEYIQNIVKLGTIYEVLEKEYDIREEKMENTLKKIVKDKYTEIIKEDEEEIKNEFQLLSNQLKPYMKNKEGLEIINCKYNNEELSYDKLVEELYNHKFPQYITEKNIIDTLEDEYEIDTNYFYIKRNKGGNISIQIKN